MGAQCGVEEKGGSDSADPRGLRRRARHRASNHASCSAQLRDFGDNILNVFSPEILDSEKPWGVRAGLAAGDVDCYRLSSPDDVVGVVRGLDINSQMDFMEFRSSCTARRAERALGNLQQWNPAVVADVGRAGGAALLVEALSRRTRDAKLAEMLVDGIARCLASNDDCVAQVLESNGARVIANAMFKNAETENIQLCGCCCLLAIVTADNVDIGDASITTVLYPVIKSMTTYPKNIKIQHHGIEILSRLVRGNTAAALGVCQSSGVPAIRSALKTCLATQLQDQRHDLVYTVFRAYTSIVKGCAEGAQCLGTERVMESVIQLLRSRGEDPRLQALGIDLLARAVAKDAGCSARVKKSHGFTPVLQALTAFSEDAEVSQACLFALARFMTTGSMSWWDLKPEVVPDLRSAADAVLDLASAMGDLAIVIAAPTEDPRMMGELTSFGFLDTLERAGHQFYDDAYVVHALSVFAEFASRSRHQAVQLRDRNWVQLLVEGCARHLAELVQEDSAWPACRALVQLVDHRSHLKSSAVAAATVAIATAALTNSPDPVVEKCGVELLTFALQRDPESASQETVLLAAQAALTSLKREGREVADVHQLLLVLAKLASTGEDVGKLVLTEIKYVLKAVKKFLDSDLVVAAGFTQCGVLAHSVDDGAARLAELGFVQLVLKVAPAFEQDVRVQACVWSALAEVLQRSAPGLLEQYPTEVSDDLLSGATGALVTHRASSGVSAAASEALGAVVQHAPAAVQQRLLQTMVMELALTLATHPKDVSVARGGLFALLQVLRFDELSPGTFATILTSSGVEMGVRSLRNLVSSLCVCQVAIQLFYHLERRSHSSHAVVGITARRGASTTSSLARRLVAIGALGAVCGAMLQHPEDAIVARFGSSVVGKVAQSASADEIVDSGCAQALHAVATQHSDDSTVLNCLAEFFASSCGSTAHLGEVLSVGAAAVVAAMNGLPEDIRLCRNCLEALAQMADAGACTAIVKAGGVSATLEALRHGDALIIANAAFTISRIVAGEDTDTEEDREALRAAVRGVSDRVAEQPEMVRGVLDALLVLVHAQTQDEARVGLAEGGAITTAVACANLIPPDDSGELMKVCEIVEMVAPLHFACPLDASVLEELAGRLEQICRAARGPVDNHGMYNGHIAVGMAASKAVLAASGLRGSVGIFIEAHILEALADMTDALRRSGKAQRCCLETISGMIDNDIVGVVVPRLAQVGCHVIATSMTLHPGQTRGLCLDLIFVVEEHGASGAKAIADAIAMVGDAGRRENAVAAAVPGLARVAANASAQEIDHSSVLEP
mmetsp:Transcript_28363/g.73360  ORF Transcript_28363/g.73360 Transcript_28363/m.73360 type:complete len:1304 (-) Transcript_28363:6-3917(-)